MQESSVRSRLAPLTVGFGTAVAMWTVGYFCRLPHSESDVLIPGWLLLVGLVACVIVGGLTLGRHSGWGLPGGLLAGAICGTVNLLVFGSLITGAEPNEVLPAATIWVPGFIAALAVIMGVASFVQSRAPGPQWSPNAWLRGFGVVMILATFMVVIAGGIVTSQEAGLAVPDWPNSFGSNMFLYPLSKMTGGIYYEHAHRLYGALVGLTAIVFFLISVFHGPSRLRPWTFIVLLLIIGQGVMGGLRVTELNTHLGIAHGVLGQIIFALACLTAMVATEKWLGKDAPVVEGAATDRTLTGVLVACLLMQLALGAMYRHMFTVETPMPWPAHAHLTMAAVIFVLGPIVGIRTWSRYGDVPTIQRHGMILLGLLALQLLLGIAALVSVIMQEENETGLTMTIFTVAHQANGALVLGVATLQAAWVRRLVAVPGGATSA